MNDMQVGRNDPCPCGSGKKFKRCCLQSPNFQRSAAPARFSFQPAQRAAARNAPPPQKAGAFDSAPSRAASDEPDAPGFHTVPLLPVEVGLHYTYPEPFGNAEVTYIFSGGKFFFRENQTHVCVDDIKVGDRIVLNDDNIATITEVQHYYEPPEPPIRHEDGQLFSRVIGTVKHMAPAVLDVEWAGYTASNTPGHRYYSVTRRDYVPAYDLRVGELLRTDDNLVTPVLSVSAPRWGLIDVYNMEVEHYHNYFVGSGKGNAVLVHNGVGAGSCMSTPKPAKDRADLHIELRTQGYQYHHTTQGGYVLYRNPNGSQVWIRPNGQVIRTGPPVTPTGGGNPYRPRVDAAGNPITTHSTNEFVEPLPQP